MDPTLQDVLARLDRVSGQMEELRDGFKQAVAIADLDPDMALTRARKVLEFIVRDVFQRHTGEEAGTRPLENLLQRLVKDGRLPKRLSTYANTVRELGNVGTHAYGEGITKSDVVQSLTQLTVILEWYFVHERPAEARKVAAPKEASAADAAVATVSAGNNAAPVRGAAARTRAARRVGWLIGLAVLAIGAVGSWWWSTRPPLPPAGAVMKGTPELSHGSAPKATERGQDDSLGEVKTQANGNAGGEGPPDGHAAGETAPSGTPAAALKFQTAASTAGRFTVEMPGEPKETIDRAGTDEEAHTFAVALPDGKVFRVEYVDLVGFGVDPKNAQVMLDGFREGYRPGAKFEREKEITLKKYGLPGREYFLESPKGRFVRERLFLSGDRVYALHVVSGDKDFLVSKDAEHFFASFQITR